MPYHIIMSNLRHNQRDLGLDGLLDTGGGDGGTVQVVRSCAVADRSPCQGAHSIRDEDGRGSGARLADALLNVCEDGEAEVLLAGLLGVGAADDLCACGRESIGVWRHQKAGQLRTVLDGLLRVEAVARISHSRPLSPLSPSSPARTHVPCLPVKPWNSTLVSPLMRRFLIVSAYCDEPVA